MKKLKDITSTKMHGIPPHTEVLLRVTLASFCGFALSVGAPASIVPSTLAYLIGIAASSLAVAVPTLLFGIGAVFPTVLVALIMALGGSSMLLAAATVSNALLVIVFTIYTLWMCGLKHGPTRSKTSTYTSILIVIAAMMALSFRTLVQDGITVALPDVQDSVLLPLVQPALEAYCSNQGLAQDCWKEQLPNDGGSIQFEIPGNGNFAGQSAEIIFADSGNTMRIPGGLWVVAGLWKWQGLDNPLANNRNFLIAFCWSMACVVVAVILPPFRTARSAISRGLLPAVLTEVQASLLSDVKRHSKSDGETNGDSSKEENDDGEENGGGENNKEQQQKQEEEERVGRLIHYVNTLESGGLAALTAFEPRLFTAPFECSWPILKNLIKQSSAQAYTAVTMRVWSPPAMLDDPNVQATMENAANAIQTCATALQQNAKDPSSLQDLLTEKPNDSDDEENNAVNNKSIIDQSNRFLTEQSQELLQATLSWLNAMHHPDSPWPCTKKWFGNVAKTYGLWMVGMLPVIKRLVETLTIPVRPKLWNLRSTLMSIKWTLGFVTLFVMSIYWEGYNNFAFDLDNPGVSGLYSGWNLLAYAFCWQGTLEGSVKKGIARSLGTAFGGFSAWLAVIVCSGSYDVTADINPYGLVAWLTVTTAIAAHFTINKGAAARFGSNADHGAVGMYFICTQSLCALEVNAGSGDRDDIVVNRIIATLSGVAMCIIFSLVPPYECGGDPKHAGALLNEVKGTLASSVQVLLSEKGETVEQKVSELKDLQTQFTKVAPQKRGDALFLFKDASHLVKLPFLKVDPQLKVEIEKISVTGCLVLSFSTFAQYLVENPKADEAYHQSDQHRQQLERAYKELTTSTDNDKNSKEEEVANAQDDKKVEDMPPPQDELETPDEYLAAIMRLLNLIIRLIEAHETSLSTIKGDWFGKR